MEGQIKSLFRVIVEVIIKLSLFIFVVLFGMLLAYFIINSEHNIDVETLIKCNNISEYVADTGDRSVYSKEQRAICFSKGIII